MKTWVIILLVIIFVFVIVPLIYFAIIAKTVRTGIHDLQTSDCSDKGHIMIAQNGKEWKCVNGDWKLVNIQNK